MTTRNGNTMTRICHLLLLCSICTLGLGLYAETTADPNTANTAEVWRIQIPELYASGKHDGELVLFHRDQRFINGYVRTPTRDNLLHLIDPTPAPSSVWVDKQGKPIDIPRGMKTRYGYKSKIFLEYKDNYFNGEIDLQQDPAPALSLSDNKLSGLIDVMFLGVDIANNGSRGRHSVAYRLNIDSTVTGDQLNGTVTIQEYHEKDLTFGKHNPKRSISITGFKDADYWNKKLAKNLPQAPNGRWLMVLN